MILIPRPGVARLSLVVSGGGGGGLLSVLECRMLREGPAVGLENIPMRTTTDFKWTKGEKVDN